MNTDESAGGGADIEKLADKVYRLLQTEVRVGQARGERMPPRPERRRPVA